MDECQLGYCQNNASCINLIGSYSCACAAGFTGRNCSGNIHECASDPCRNNGTCHDEVGRYRCECKLGFNGSNCENDIDWCSGEPCKNDGNCTDGIETYNCVCHEGYLGKNCEIDVNECKSNPCLNGGTCIEKSHLPAVTTLFGSYSIDRQENFDRRYDTALSLSLHPYPASASLQPEVGSSKPSVYLNLFVIESWCSYSLRNEN